MDKFFYESLKTGVFISAFILLTLLLSKVISHVFNANWRFQVWKVYTACLILPTSYIMSKIRIPDLEQRISTIAQPAVLENATPVHDAFELINAQGPAIAIGKQFNTLSSCFFIVWLLGAFVYSAYLLGTYFHLKNFIKRAEPLDKITAYDLQADFLKSNRIKKMIPIRRCKFISVPIIAGIRKPTILLPDKEYEKEKLKIIIGHELTHYLRHDLWCKGVALLALVLHWYNPIVHMMNRALNTDIEACCDQDVIRNKDKGFRNLYSDVIMDSILDSHQFKGTLFACMGSKKKEAEARFLNIHTDKKKNGSQIFLIVLLMVALLGLLSFADTGSKFDLAGQPEYEELLAQRIAEQEELIRARNEYWLEHPEALAISEENQIIYPRTSKNTEKEKRFNVKESVIEPHILDNGETGLYLNKDGEPWKIDAGDTVQIKIGADIKHFNSSGYLMWGYDTGQERILIDSFYIKEENSLEFKAPANGEYTFFLTCGSSDPIIIKYLLID